MTEKKVKKEKKPNLWQKLMLIKKDIGILQKTEAGNQGATYVDPAVILFKINNAMERHGVILTCEAVAGLHKSQQVPMPTAKNQHAIGYIVEAPIIYTWINIEDGEKFACSWFAVGKHMSDPAMAYGSALTYAERYFCLKFFQIPTPKYDPEYLPAKSGDIPLIEEKEAVDLLSLMEEKKVDPQFVLNRLSIDDFTQMNKQQYQSVVNWLVNEVK